MRSGTATYVRTDRAFPRMNALVTSVAGLGVLVLGVLVGGPALFSYIAAENAQEARTAVACHELRIDIESAGSGVALINRGEHAVNGTLTVEEDGTTINTTRVDPIPPHELVQVAVPDGDTAVFTPDGCDRTFTASLT